MVRDEKDGRGKGQIERENKNDSSASQKTEGLKKERVLK